MAGEIEQNLQSMGITLPVAAAPAANYVPFVRSGTMVYISGQVPMGASGIEHIGKLGDTYTVEQGQAAAKLCAVNILAQAKAALGDLDKLGRLVKLTGFVNATPDFGDHPKVINGASDFLVEALGDKGKHSRSAVGVGSLPFGVAVEIEAIVEAA